MIRALGRWLRELAARWKRRRELRPRPTGRRAADPLPSLPSRVAPLRPGRSGLPPWIGRNGRPLREVWR